MDVHIQLAQWERHRNGQGREASYQYTGQA
jgi:hypothetical protein